MKYLLLIKVHKFKVLIRAKNKTNLFEFELKGMILDKNSTYLLIFRFKFIFKY